MQVARTKTWSALSAYESTELVKRFVEDRIKKEFNVDKAREIAAHFSQGREYFRSAAGASELVRPLILYYGAVALARGTVLFLEACKSGLAPIHGLSANNWENLSAKPEAVAHQRVKIQKEGTFPELWRVTSNTERCMVRSERLPGEVTARSVGPKVEPGASVSIKEVLGQIPDVAELYERTFDEHPRRLRCELMVTGAREKDPSETSIHGEVPPDREVRCHAWLGIVPTRAGFPPKDWIADSLDEGRVVERETGTNLLHFAHEPAHRVRESHLFNLYYDAGSHERPRQEMPVTISAFGEEYLKLPTEGGIVLSTLLALHLVAFAAGMLVRYHPGYWALVVGRREGNSIAPILSAAVAAVEERYPALILEAIGG